MTKRWGVAAAAVLCCLLWGSAFPMLKLSYLQLDVSQTPQMVLLAGYRFIAAGGVLLLFTAVFLKTPVLPSRAEWPVIIAVALAQTFIGYALYYIGMGHAMASKVAILTSSEVFFTVLVSHFAFRDDRINARKILGMAIGVIGVLIINYKGAAGEIWSFSLEGEGFIILSALLMAAAMVTVKKRSGSIHIIRVNAWQALLGGALLTVAGLLTNAQPMSFDAGSIGTLAYLAAITAVAFSLWYLIINKNRTGETAVYKLLSPVFGSLIAVWLLADERFTWPLGVGLACITAGIAVTNINRKRNSKTTVRCMMKRSEINAAIDWAIALLEKNNIRLPHFAYWDMDTWKGNKDKLDVVRRVMLGWDVTDYGRGQFDKFGSVLFTIRNGDIQDNKAGTPFAEKLILVKDGQYLPTHFHYDKTEDIINRGGGVLAIRLYNAASDHAVDYKADVEVYMDGIRHIVKPDNEICIDKGNSVTITPYMYHLFGAKPGCGDLIVGEVSSINDDNKDNRFEQQTDRFISIEEDEPIKYPLCNEYGAIFD